MKQVWILNHHASAPDKAGGTRHHGLAKHLQNYGWQATIIAGSTDLHTGAQQFQPGQTSDRQFIDGVTHCRIRTHGYKGNGLSRVLGMVSYSARVLRRKASAELARPHAIIGSSVHPLAAWAGHRLAVRFGVPFIFEVRDLWPETLIAMGRIHSRGPVAFGLRLLERHLYRRADQIIVLMPFASEYITPLGVSSEKICWIPNGVELDSVVTPKLQSNSPQFTFMYFGGHTQATGLDCLIRACSLLQRTGRTDIAVRLIGDGPTKPELRELAQRMKLNNVVFEPPVSKSEIPKIAREADAFVMCTKDLPRLYRYGISMNKLYDYFAAARPVVIATAARNNPVRESQAGVTAMPDNPASLAQAMAEVASMSAEAQREMGRRGRQFVTDHHGYDVLSRRLAMVLDEITRISEGVV